MTKQQAHAILDAARAGLPVTEHQITAALIATGDIGRDHQGIVRVHREVGDWERPTPGVRAQWLDVLAV